MAFGDANGYYLATILDCPEYIWVQRDRITAVTLAHFASKIFWTQDCTTVRCDKGISCLPHADLFVRKLTCKALGAFKYFQLT